MSYGNYGGGGYGGTNGYRDNYGSGGHGASRNGGYANG